MGTHTDAASDDRARLGALTGDEMGRLDAAAVACGIEILQLMEVAGLQVARCAWRLLGDGPGSVAVIAGRGNNGGDGLVAARHLRAWGCAVRVHVVADPHQPLRGALPRQVLAARGAGVVVTVGTNASAIRDMLQGADLAIDAILGTGLRESPREPDASAVRALQEHAAVLAIDVPSGCDASSGAVHDPCVHAVETCTLTACKRGLWQPSARAVAGRVVVADIGMPATAWEAAGLVAPTGVRAAQLVDVW